MNFLAKTIGNLESRLDSVLLGDQDQLAKQSPKAAENKLAERAEGASTPLRTGSPAPPIPRNATPSGGAGKLSLAERLAAATARSASPVLRTASPAVQAPVRVSTRNSIDQSTRPETPKESNNIEKDVGVLGEDDETGKAESAEEGEAGYICAQREETIGQLLDAEVIPSLPQAEHNSIVPVASEPQVDGLDKSNRYPTPTVTPNMDITDSAAPGPLPSTTDYDTTISQLREDLATCELRRQEESHAASERIDTLENKLKYLARESAEEAKQRAATSPAGGLGKKIAEKEEQIALLLEEGDRLSKLELKNLTIIKRLRAKAAEDEKVYAEAKRKLEKAEKEVIDGKDKLKKALESEKRLNERLKMMNKLEGETEGLRREQSNKDILILELQSQVSIANSRADEAESRAQSEALEAEQKITRDLREQVEREQVAATLVEEKLRIEINDLKAKIERDSARSQMVQAELRSEVAAMETKMEVVRARAEEASSGATGDAHSKLLRQVEMLQTQYAIASENWQGIEGSLLARVAAVEKERDELAQTEAGIRRKARELSTRVRRLETALEAANSTIKDLEDDKETFKDGEESLQKKIAGLETALSEAKMALERAREEFDSELSQKLEDQRMKWEEQLASSTLIRSPSPPPQRFSLKARVRSPADPYTQQFPPLQRRDTSGSSSFVEQTLEVSPRGKERPPLSTPKRVDSLLQFVHPVHENSPKTPLIMDEDEALFISNYQNASVTNLNRLNTASPMQHALGAEMISPSPSSPFGQTLHRATPHPPDFASVSVAAGPSVQLVERMSAAVRRLETEMAASRDELSRMVAQRDEARSEIVELMREVESKRALEDVVRKLTVEKGELDTRFQAALDTLGEKIERVDDLEDQMADLKAMYKDLVIRTSG